MDVFQGTLIILGFVTVRIILPTVTLLALGTWINRHQPYDHQFK
jgi:hypothetical protein